MKPVSLDFFFKPNSVAVIGASNKEESLGREVFLNLLSKSKGKIKVYPVNIKEKEVLGIKAYPSVLDIPNEIDLAVIVVRNVVVPQVLEECTKKGVKGAIIISGGFKESKSFELEERIIEISKRYGMRIIGPNCQGVLDLNNDFYCWFGPVPKKKGKMAFITQSGGLAGTIINYTNQLGVPLFNKVISIGNKCDIDELELLEYLGADPDVEGILIYTEGFKPKRGKIFIDLAKKISKNKPIIILKGGKHEASKRAISSHTGSLAGNDAVYNSAFIQAHVVRVNTIRDFINVAVAFSMIKQLPKGNRVGILTNLGGVGVLASDLCTEAGLEVPELPKDIQEKLREKLPSFFSFVNPVDVTASGGPEDYRACLRALYEASNIDSVLITTGPLRRIEEIAGIIVQEYKNYRKPTIVCWLPVEKSEIARKILLENGIPAYEMPEDAVLALAILTKYKMWVKEK